MMPKLQVLRSRRGYFDASPIKDLNPVTIEEGILLLYFVEKPFSLGAVLLDKNLPKKVIWRTFKPIWQTGENIIPLQVEKQDQKIIFHFKLNQMPFSLEFKKSEVLGIAPGYYQPLLERSEKNPILTPNQAHDWESDMVYNSAALYIEGKFHFIYRAIGRLGISVFGYASSKNGVDINKRSLFPVYKHSSYQAKTKNSLGFSYPYMSGGSWSGCEDPRLVNLDGNIYMTYTSFNGSHAPQMALTSISVKDFLKKRWKWKKPVMLSSAHQVHKNWVIFPEKINGKYAILHSITPEIKVEYFDDLDFKDNTYIESQYASVGREEYWDNWIRGAGPPPIKINEGWLLLYHAMDYRDPNRYKIGAKILDGKDPTKTLYRSELPLLEPDAAYENQGHKSGVIYSCGAVLKDETLFVYYGGADTVMCVAIANLQTLLMQIKNSQAITMRKITA